MIRSGCSLKLFGFTVMEFRRTVSYRGIGMAPEDNHADDQEPTREEYEAYEREREQMEADCAAAIDDSDIEE